MPILGEGRIQNSCLDTALYLLEKNGFVDDTDQRGYTPLCNAAAAGNTPMIKLLTSKGANVHHRTNKGHSTLYLAATTQNSDTVKALREYGADLSFIDLVSSNDMVLKILAESGANLAAKDPGGRTLLHWAVWEGKESFTGWLLDHGLYLLEAVDHDGWTPLHYAIHEDRINIAKLLIKRGAKVDSGDKWGHSPLHYTKASDILHTLTQHVAE